MDTVKKEDEIKDEINDCVICLNTLDKDDKSIITVKCCNNQFHVKCYLDCMKERQTCPLCRTLYFEKEELHTSHISHTPLPDTIIHINDYNDINQLRKKNVITLCVLLIGVPVSFYYILVGYIHYLRN